jgi:hypothetical protein
VVIGRVSRCSRLAQSSTIRPFSAIGEIVHDIDLKDGKFGREEALGIARLVDGIAAATKDDGRRLERGAALLDDLYQSFRVKRG